MIKISTLHVGPRLGGGGQGDVFELPDDPEHLVKRYRPEIAVNEAGLVALVDWRAGLPPKDGAIIAKHTAWPQEIVDCEDGTFGIIMKRAAASFWHTVEDEKLPRDLSWAYLQDSARFAGLTTPPPRAAVQLMIQLATVLDVLHRNGVVYGDLSATNVLWTGGTAPNLFVIDCDAAHVEGGPRALDVAQTPLWSCPWPGVEGRERDEFKLALAFLRLYFCYEGPIDLSTQNLLVPDHPPVSRAAADLVTAGLQQLSVRPSAGDWLPVLRHLAKGLRARGL